MPLPLIMVIQFLVLVLFPLFLSENDSASFPTANPVAMVVVIVVAFSSSPLSHTNVGNQTHYMNAYL